MLYVPEEMEKFLTEGWGSHIFKLMWKYWIKIEIKADKELLPDEYKFILKSSGEDITEKFIA